MKNATRKTIYLLIFIVIVLLGLRFLSGPEDSWVCDRGEWVRHGNPESSPPNKFCDQ